MWISIGACNYLHVEFDALIDERFVRMLQGRTSTLKHLFGGWRGRARDRGADHSQAPGIVPSVRLSQPVHSNRFHPP